MSGIPSIENQRIEHINMLMEEVYENASHIYESLVDRDFSNLREAIDAHVETLLYIRNSISDEP